MFARLWGVCSCCGQHASCCNNLRGPNVLREPLQCSGDSSHGTQDRSLRTTQCIWSCSGWDHIGWMKYAVAQVRLRSAAAAAAAWLPAANCCFVFSLLLQFWKSSHCCCCIGWRGPERWVVGAHASLKHYFLLDAPPPTHHTHKAPKHIHMYAKLPFILPTSTLQQTNITKLFMSYVIKWVLFKINEIEHE